MDRQPATHSTATRRLGRLPSGRELTVTVHRYDGGPGPTVYVQAAQHGIELDGPAALRRLHGRLGDAALAGTVVTVPVANPPAFDHRTYMTPTAFDAVNPNLNRVWPGDAAGTPAERFAAQLWPLARDADAVVDLHTGTADMLEHVRYAAGDETAARLAAAFGVDYRLADPGDHDGKLRTAAAEAGVPAVTAELGNSRTVERSAAETGADGVVGVLRALDVLPGEPPDDDGARLRDDAEHTVAGVAGLFELSPAVDCGDRVEAGTELGAVYSPTTFERLETVTAAAGGVVYSLARESVVFAGDRLAAVGTAVE